MIKNKNKILGLLLTVVILITAGYTIATKKTDHGGDKELNTVRLPIDIWPGNFWVAIADKKGYFEEEGLRAEIIDVSANYNEYVDKFINNDVIDTMNLAVFDLVEANATGADLVTVLVADNSLGAEGMAAKKEYQKLVDLKGKRIGVEIGSYLDYYLEVAMLNAGIGSDEYTKVDIVTEELENKFEEEKLDAAFSWEPHLTQIKKTHDLEIIFDTSDMRGLSLSIFPLKREFIEKRPDDVQKLLNAWYKATEFIQNNKKEAYNIITQIDFVDEPGIFYSYEEIEELVAIDPIYDLEDNLKAFGFETGFESLYGNIQYVARFIQRENENLSIPNTNRMLTDQFLHNINK